MTKLSISIPDEAKEFVEAQVRDNRFESASTYVAFLIQKEQANRNRQQIDNLLLEGLESGPATPMAAKDWQAIHDEVFGETKRRTRKAARKQKET